MISSGEIVENNNNGKPQSAAGLEALKAANPKVESKGWLSPGPEGVTQRRLEAPRIWLGAFREAAVAGVGVNKSDVTPMRKMGEMIQRHLENILTFCRHRITNGVAEGLNSKIMAIKRKACGYRNRDHFKTAIYFFCGGLDLYPTSS
ncbi:transposase [Desulfovibrio sp. TomC]|uniref:transposase n=1 Tax=Desulfovibrio sp. TomC TaxID=1562888 RepID=UPI0009E4C3AD|nr:transposase [Desulfovibrio sp. TomC]